MVDNTNLVKQIRNATDGYQTWVGQLFAPDEVYVLQPTDFGHWAYDDEVIAAINDGYAVVGDGYDEFTDAELAKEYFQASLMVIKKNQGAQTLSQATGILNFNTYTDAAFDGYGQASVITRTEDNPSLVGNSYTMAFARDSSVNDKWLGNINHTLYSNEAPAPALFKSKLIGMTYTNDIDNSDTDIQIYKVTEANGNSPKVLLYTWDLRDARTARNTSVGSIEIEAGDKIAVFAKDQGVKPHDVVVVLHWRIQEDNSEESVKEWSGNIE